MRRATISYMTTESRTPRTLEVDVAESYSERVAGLSGTTPVRGLVFPRSSERGAEYTMTNMIVPIEIYFVGAGGAVQEARVAHPGSIVRYSGNHLWFVAELPLGSTSLLAKSMSYR